MQLLKLMQHVPGMKGSLPTFYQTCVKYAKGIHQPYKSKAVVQMQLKISINNVFPMKKSTPDSGFKCNKTKVHQM